MDIPKNIQSTLGQLMAFPSLDLARQLERELSGLGYRKEVFGEIVRNNRKGTAATVLRASCPSTPFAIMRGILTAIAAKNGG